MGGHNDFINALVTSDITFEEGVVRGRTIQTNQGLTSSLPDVFAKVNGPKGDKGQYLWMGTYDIQLNRGISLPAVPHLCLFGNVGAQIQRVLAYGEQVAITWLNRQNVQIPVILEGVTLGYYAKLLQGRGHLLDAGEQIIRSAMAATPGAAGEFPFADNQFNNPAADVKIDGTSSSGDIKLVNKPGAETFHDKFGRLLTLAREVGNEFLVTHGRTDSGQDDVQALATVSAQDAYYDKILHDESEPEDVLEPFAPKPLNLAQYQLTTQQVKVVGDKDAARTSVVGALPRFDKWRFLPVQVREYDPAGTSGLLVTDEQAYASYQERQNSKAGQPGYLRTITDHGDVKLFVPRHVNMRALGDVLVSVAGNIDLRVKHDYVAADAAADKIMLVHQEMLADGTYRLRVNETTPTKAAYDHKVLPDGTTTLVVGDNKAKITITPAGAITIDVQADVSIKTTGATKIDAKTCEIKPTDSCTIESKDITVKGNTTITGGKLTTAGTVTPGSGPYNCIKNCLFTGALHTGSVVTRT